MKDKTKNHHESREEHASTSEQDDPKDHAAVSGRRQFLSKAAVGGAAFVAGLYVKPQVTTLLGPQVAQAAGSYCTPVVYEQSGISCSPDVCTPVQLEQAGLCSPYICSPGDSVCSPAYCSPHGF